MEEYKVTDILLADDSKVFVKRVQSIINSYYQNSRIHVVERLDALEDKLLEIKPEVLILDLYFPDGDALDKIDEIKAVHPDMELIVVSGQTDIRIALKSLKKGADHYIVKDDGFNSDLLAALKAITDKLQLKQQLNRFGESIFKSDIYPFVVFKATELGSEIVYKDFEEFPEVLKKSTDEYLIGLGLTILVGLGQGHLYHEGSYSYPAGGSNFYSLLVFSLRIPDVETTDARFKDGYYQFVLFVPNSFWSMFPAATEVSNLIDDFKKLLPSSAVFSSQMFLKIKMMILNEIKSYMLRARRR